VAQVIEGRKAVTEGGDDVNFSSLWFSLCGLRDNECGRAWSMGRYIHCVYCTYLDRCNGAGRAENQRYDWDCAGEKSGPGPEDSSGIEDSALHNRMTESRVMSSAQKVQRKEGWQKMKGRGKCNLRPQPLSVFHGSTWLRAFKASWLLSH